MRSIEHGRDKTFSKLFAQLTTVNILIGLIQPCNQLIDSIFIGSGLGTSSMNVYGLFLTVNSLIMAFGSFFAIGTQLPSSNRIGMGCVAGARKISGTGFLSALIFSLLCVAVIYVFSEQIAVFLGADDAISGQLMDLASYLRFYALGIPAIILTQIQMVLMQLEGKKSVVIVFSLMVLAVNGLGDWLNLFVFHGGIQGMALATSVANIIVFFVTVIYSQFSLRMFRFSLMGFEGKLLKDIVKSGSPNLVYYGSIAIRTLFFNYLIITCLDSDILAIMAVVNSFLAVVDAFMGGMGNAITFLGGILTGERDKDGKRNLIKTGVIHGTIMLSVIMLITMIAAEPIAMIFINADSTAYIDDVARALRLTSLCFIPDVLNCVIKKYLQTVGRDSYVSLTNFLCNVIYVCSGAFVFVLLVGSDGLFLSYTFCYTATLLTHLLFACRVADNPSAPIREKLLFLSPEDDIPDENIWVCSISDINGCVRGSEEVQMFCLSRGIDAKKGYILGLITEEMTTNAILYGRESHRDTKVVVKVMIREERVTLNIKDNCKYFNPVRYYEKMDKKRNTLLNHGVDIAMELSENIVYNNNFNMNHLLIEV